MSDLLKKLLFVPALGLGVLMFALLKGCSDPPPERPPDELATPVRVITYPPGGIDLLPRAIGYGTVSARRQWHSVAQVGGRIVEFNERLRRGAFLSQGDSLLRIDASDYEIEARRATAQLASLQAQLEQLDEREKQYTRQIAVEQRSLELARAELERAESLAARGIDAATNRDAQEREVLRQETVLSQIQDALALLPTQRKDLIANRDAQQATIDRTRVDIERCHVRAPYDVRVLSLDVELSQVVTAGQVMFRAEGIEFAEVAAQVPTMRFGPVIAMTEPRDVATTPMGADLAELLGVTAIVRLESGAMSAQWPARMVRVENIQPDIRTVPVVVEVKGPYKGVVPGRRPPLVSGMYVEVELRGAVRKGLTVLPLSAVRDGGRVYVADSDNRLRMRSARVLFEQGAIGSIETKLEDGDRVIVSDPIPAVAGMLLAPVNDEAALADLQSRARGEGTVR